MRKIQMKKKILKRHKEATKAHPARPLGAAEILRLIPSKSVIEASVSFHTNPKPPM